MGRVVRPSGEKVSTMAEARAQAAPGHDKPGTCFRLCEAYFVFIVAELLVFGFLCPPALFEYDLSMIRVLVLMAGSAVTLWLMSRRAQSARPVGAVTALAGVALTVVDHAAFGAYETLASYIGHVSANVIVVFECAIAVAAAAYLIFAPDAKRVLCEPPDWEPGATSGHSWDVPLRQRVRTWEFWRNLMIYFIAFSLLGHWAEMLFCQLIVAGVFMGDYDPTNAMLWSQWLFPFTAEGAAAVCIVLILHPAARWLVKKTHGRVWLAVILSFLLNMLVCTTIDFTTGMVANQDYSLWDYRALPFNFMGQVCLQNSLIYSIAATLIVWVFYPMMDTVLHRMPRGVANALGFGLIGMYLFLAMLHFVDLSLFF